MKKFDDLPSPAEDLELDKRPLEVSRRHLLAGTAGAVAVTGLAAGAALAKGAPHHHPMHGKHPPMGPGGMDMGQGAFPHLANSKEWFQPFMEPNVVTSSRAGVCEQELNVGFADIVITTFDDKGNPVPRTQCVRCYNNSVPGTTFRIMPGDALKFTVNNRMPSNRPAPPPASEGGKPVYDCDQLMDHNFPGCFNTTNLHTHGLHVSPKSTADLSSDDVAVKILPTEDTFGMNSACMSGEQCYTGTRKYCVQLPTFHAPGTHWYHAHVHGATGIQVSNGLAGTIIIEEPDNQRIKNPDGSPIPEHVWMVQEVIGGTNAPSACNNPDTDEVYLSGSSVYGGMAASLTDSTTPYGGKPASVGFTVNSLSSPTLKMLPNEIQRWRIIDGTATPRGIFNFVLLQPITDSAGKVTGYKDFSNYMYLIAVDGITFYGHSPQQLPVSSDPYPIDPNTKNPTTKKLNANPNPGGWALSPGNRADVLVSLPAGTYQVWRYNNSHSGGGGFCEVLANIEVSGPVLQPVSPGSVALPGWDKAPCYLQPIWDKEINADPLSYNFQVNVDSGNGSYFGGFTINGQVYGNPDGTHPNTTVNLGDVRRTTLTNANGKGGNHPFHIHVNPFQVEGDKIDPNGPDDPTNWRWWDTILVPFNATVNTRSRYVNYDGKYVFHCHILIHEDAGMMQDFTVYADPSSTDYPPVAPCVKLEKCQMGRPKSA